MKSTGVVRKIDELGRLVIPKELRRSLDLKDDIDYLEIYTEGNMIILRKYEPTCIFCDNVENITKYKGRNICKKCAEKISHLSEESF